MTAGRPAPPEPGSWNVHATRPSILARINCTSDPTLAGSWGKMCGIHAALFSSAHTISPELRQRLCNRGPDYLGQMERRVQGTSLSLTLTSTVLALRGDHVAQQPLRHLQTDSVLCWNGEAWRIGGRLVDGNDGEAILALLAQASASSSPAARQVAILDVFRAVEGPFAFVYYDKPSETLFYGRDRLGRRSLMVSKDGASDTFILSSIAEACEPRWTEVEADGIYTLAIKPSQSGPPASGGLRYSPTRHDWLAGGQADFVSPSRRAGGCNFPLAVVQTYSPRSLASGSSTNPSPLPPPS